MNAPSSQDAYAAIRAERIRHFNQPHGPGSLVFIDLPRESEIPRLRSLPPALLRERRALLLIRAPDPKTDSSESSSDELSQDAQGIKTVIERWELEMPVALLHQPLGAEPWIEQVVGDSPVMQDPDAAARARAMELEALLEWGNAIWKPSAYHFLLPSGEHAGEFVKVSDAIREPRDAEVLASWLGPHLQEGLGFVLDTGTLTPIFEAAARHMADEGIGTGAVVVLERYPKTAIDVATAVSQAAGDQGRILALLSVNSSGVVRDRIDAAIENAPGISGRVVVLIDKDQPPRKESIETWSPLRDRDPLLTRGSRAAEMCRLCGGSKRSRIVPINPATFDGMLPDQLRPVMMSVRDARDNWRLWEECGGERWVGAPRTGAIVIESRSELSAPGARPEAVPMPIRIEMHELVGNDSFQVVAHDRLEHLTEAIDTNDPFSRINWRREPFRPNANLVLVAEHEHDYDRFSDFWSAVEDQVAPGADLVPFPVNREFDASLQARIAEASSIIVFALGTVTGFSLQQALLAVQHAHRGVEYEVQGIVIHSRPATSREWRTLCNSFDGRLHAAWLSFLPERSPLQEELTGLKQLDLNLYEGELKRLVEARLRLCSGEIPETPTGLFLGTGPDARVTRNSILGQRLDARTTYAAVAAAMARARIAHDRATTPELRVFDIAGMVRSYYDPLIICAFLRWLAPHEAWWGWQRYEAERASTWLLERANPEDLEILIPELWLAASQGKLHEAAIENLRPKTDQLKGRASDEVLAAVKLGEELFAISEAEPQQLERLVAAEPGRHS